jgi:tRNA threonylcarbamoyladenosine biosynthesis protein TsaB
MRILAIETSLINGSVAAIDNETVRCEISLDPQRRTTRTLSPVMQQILRQVGWRPLDVQCVSVSIGPGSFTGLRIGVTAAKAFAYATGAKIAGVNTLQVLAKQAPLANGPLWAVVNAERSQVYTSQFQVEEDRWIETRPPQIVDVSEWSTMLTAETLVTGPALHDLASTLPSHVTMASQELWTPRAATVGELGYRQIDSGRREDLWSLAPFYLRESAAQEKARGGK